MPKIELLNCPFCGGKAERVLCQDRDEYGSLIGFPFWAVKCKSCGAEIWNPEEQDGMETDEMIEAAVKAWNTRAPGWIPVWVRCDEAMPEDGDYIVMTEGSVTPQVGCYSEKYACWMDWEGCTMENVTLWTTLPDPPKGDAE